MNKHFVRTLSAALLVCGSLVVVAAQPAGALKRFVHGNVHCKITSGSVAYTPTLRGNIHQTVMMKAKGTLNCNQNTDPTLQGETGVDNLSVIGGTFKIVSGVWDGDCFNTKPDEIEMHIKWMPSNPAIKIRDTTVGWLWTDGLDHAQPDPSDTVERPYGYQFAGGTVQVTGITGSYLGATAALSLLSGTGNPSDPDPGVFASQACAATATSGGRLRGGWPLDPTNGGLSELTFQSAPWINSVDPSSAVLGTQNLDVAISGQDFAPGDTVSFGAGVTINSTQFIDANNLSANISIDPDALAGMRDVTVTNETLGANTCTSCFMVAPIVSGVSPATAGQGAQNRNITITGQGFAPGAIAQFGAMNSGITTNYTQFIDGNTLVANISVANGAPLTTYDVTVQDPGFGLGTCTACFSVNSGPTVTSTSPGSRGAGATNQTVTINGTGFANGSTVAFGGSGISIDNTSYVSPTQLAVTIDVATGTPNGPRSVTVVNPDGGQGACAACFAVNKGPTVTLWQVTTLHPPHSSNPNPDPIGRRDRDVVTVDVTITGTNFMPGVAVTYPGAAVTTFIVNSQTYVSTTKIKQNITIDYGDYSQLQTNPPDRTVIVTNPDGGRYAQPGAVILVG